MLFFNGYTHVRERLDIIMEYLTAYEIDSFALDFKKCTYIQYIFKYYDTSDDYIQYCIDKYRFKVPI
jgi:hypothetical protein